MVDVYPLALSLLGVDAKQPHNGTWEHVADLLSDSWNYRPSDYDAATTSSPSATLFCLALVALVLHTYRPALLV